jgi:glycosyltransferase involved in cell wall biosynthesis
MTRQFAGNPSKIKVLALLEPDVVTGAAKSLLDFCRAAQEHQASAPEDTQIETTVATYVRPNNEGANNSSHEIDSSRESEKHFADYKKHSDNAPAPNQFVAAARAAGLTVDIIPERFRFDRRVVPELRRVVALRKPDVIVSYHVKSHFLVKTSGLWRERAWIAFHHGYTTTDLKMRLYNQMDRFSLPTAHRVLTVCDAFARDLMKNKGVRAEQLRVQHNSIRRERESNPEAGRELRARFGIAPNEKVILAIGRLSREKAHIDLIEALGLLRREQPTLNWRLIIAGDGPERALLEKRANELGIGESIVYAGHVLDAQPYYAAANVMALPSHSEGSPFVLLEAMAAGVPVVATSVGGVPEMVTNEESALLVRANQPAELANALGRVLQESKLARRLAAAADALINTRYSPETYFRSLSGVYAEVANSNY